MIEYTCDVAVIGAGPADYAASSAREAGAEKFGNPSEIANPVGYYNIFIWFWACLF